MDIPLFIDTKESPVRPDLPFVERNAITAVVYDPKADKYLGLRWKDGSGWETLVTGGVEEGQTPEEAARAEVHEETGYKHLRLMKELSRYDSKFFHYGKQVNRCARFRCFLFVLEDDGRDPIAAGEEAKHECVWLARDELAGFRLPEGHRFVLDEALK